MLPHLLGCLVTVVVFTPVAHAADLTVEVLDPAGLEVGGAMVTLTWNSTPPVSKVLVTSPGGVVVFEALAVGRSYSLVATHEHFETSKPVSWSTVPEKLSVTLVEVEPVEIVDVFPVVEASQTTRGDVLFPSAGSLRPTGRAK